MNRFLISFAVALALGLAPAAAADNFTTIDYPDAISTGARAINDAGAIVGNYTAVGGVSHGYLLSGGKYTSIDFPEAKSSSVQAINSSGDVAGNYVDSGNKTHSFLLSQGKFTAVVDYPGADLTGVNAMNAAGVMTGHIQMPGKPMQGFILRGGAWTVVDYRPDAPSNTMNCYFGISDAGALAGHWGTRGTTHGVVYKDGKFTQLDYGGGGNLNAYGINSAGDVVGYFRDGAQAMHGFLLRNGRYTPIDVPGARQTWAYAINNAGDVVGGYTDATGKNRGFVTRFAAPAPAQILTVDDNGLDCTGALRTIQEAVTQATPGSTIRVCPGTYRGTVNIAGRAKDGLKLIATGGEDEVVLQGDYTEPDGFHLEDVNGVTIRGFTVRDFGNQATTATQWGNGGDIYLKNVNYSTIESNRIMNGDMVGIWLTDSGNNLIQNNFILMEKAAFANCGIHMGEAKSVNNLIRQNYVAGAKMAGIMISGAGAGNVISENSLTNNGRYGILNGRTVGTRIEGNRASYNRGPWGTSPYPPEVAGKGLGISIENSDKVTVFDNRARANSGVDLNWDGTGTNVFEANACDTSTPAGACGR
jgi:parallel beta-helix repeat protein/probable HAF family extracellular repeat protein